MTRRSVVVAIVALFVGVLPVSCSKSPTAPTDPPPIVIVPAAPGSPAVLSVPSGFVQFKDSITGESVPLTARFVNVLPQPSVKIAGGSKGGCSEDSTNCFQWKIELCTGEGASWANAQVHLAPNEGEKGFGTGGLEARSGCNIKEQMVQVVYDQNGRVIGQDNINNFPAGTNCCRYVNLIGVLLMTDGQYRRDIVASWFVNYENRTP